MPVAYEDDVRESMVVVINQFQNNKNASFKQDFENGDEVTTIYNRHGTGRHDYGIPAMYKASAAALVVPSKVWKESFPKHGVVLPAQYKPLFQCEQVNFVVLSDSGATLLNYHVSISD